MSDTKKTKELHDTIEVQYNKLMEKEKILQSSVEGMSSELTQVKEVLSEKEKLVVVLEADLSKISTDFKEASGVLKESKGKISVSADEQKQKQMRLDELELLVVENKKANKFIEDVITQDVKFKTLFYLNSVGESIRIDDLAHALNEQTPIVLRVIIELNNANLVKTHKEGRNLFVSMTDQLESPFLLKTIQ